MSEDLTGDAESRSHSIAVGTVARLDEWGGALDFKVAIIAEFTRRVAGRSLRRVVRRCVLRRKSQVMRIVLRFQKPDQSGSGLICVDVRFHSNDEKPVDAIPHIGASQRDSP